MDVVVTDLAINQRFAIRDRIRMMDSSTDLGLDPDIRSVMGMASFQRPISEVAAVAYSDAKRGVAAAEWLTKSWSQRGSTDWVRHEAVGLDGINPGTGDCTQSHLLRKEQFDIDGYCMMT